MFGISALPAGRRSDLLTRALDGLMAWFGDRVLAFDTGTTRLYAEWAVMAKAAGREFPTPDGYIAVIASSRGDIVASRDTAP
jgi:predicted nucleic acid-binding protein